MRDPDRSAPLHPTPVWRLRDRVVSIDRPLVVGILNLTPDSFSDGGRYTNPEAAIARAFEMVDAGADIVDIGAESSRPGADPVPEEAEWSRLEPVLAELGTLEAPISVDTTKSFVARRALGLGAAVINDISGLRFEPELAELAAESGAGLVLMHMRGVPRTMQTDTHYDDLIGEVGGFLHTALTAAVDRGCLPEQIVLDPGIGFGKSLEGNLELLASLEALASLGRPILVGPSRKTFLGQILDLPPDERVEGTIAACIMALERGAHIFRVHDVRQVRRALDVAHRVREAKSSSAAPDSGEPVEAVRWAENTRA
jgi:dihydropteroate synthase